MLDFELFLLDRLEFLEFFPPDRLEFLELLPPDRLEFLEFLELLPPERLELRVELRLELRLEFFVFLDFFKSELEPPFMLGGVGPISPAPAYAVDEAGVHSAGAVVGKGCIL